MKKFRIFRFVRDLEGIDRKVYVGRKIQGGYLETTDRDKASVFIDDKVFIEIKSIMRIDDIKKEYIKIGYRDNGKVLDAFGDLLRKTAVKRLVETFNNINIKEEYENALYDKEKVMGTLLEAIKINLDEMITEEIVIKDE